MRLKNLIPRTLLTPARLSVAAFVVIILAGSVLLSLPIASTGEPLGFSNSLFTSTSATCVTGLIVVDTGTQLSLFGQLVVLLLIQVGGLGIMTLSTAFLVATGRRLSLTGSAAVQTSISALGHQNLLSLIMDVIRFTFMLEGVGAIILTARFSIDHGVAKGIYLGVFHAVSAFCNAGFSPFADSLAAYRSDWIVNLVVAGLIIAGGIGFVVLAETRRNNPLRRKGWARLSLHTKLVLTTTTALIVGGMLLILFMEWGNTLRELPWHERLLAAFFQSVTTRTAGFNTLPIGQIANETLFLMLVLMFIGASSGSCGGGIKTGTFATLIVWGLSRLRGHQRPHAFGRSISESSMSRAISIFIISGSVIIIATLLLLMTEIGGVSHTASRGKSIEILFETVSAFGTVGLSTGVTGTLSTLGKLIITLVMFVGRLGPLVIAMAISRRKVSRYRYAEESILVG
jgi:trk system potassium uptake protein